VGEERIFRGKFDNSNSLRGDQLMFLIKTLNITTIVCSFVHTPVMSHNTVAQYQQTEFN